MFENSFLSFEPVLMQWLQQEAGPVLTALAGFFTFMGSELPLVAVLSLFYWCIDKQTGIFMGTNICVNIVAVPMVKNVVCRPRPYFSHPEVKCLVPVDASADIYDLAAQGYSFPSGHSGNSLAAYGSLFITGRKKKAKDGQKRGSGALWLLLCFFIGLSRVMTGCHYPSDVLGGWLLAVIGFAVLAQLERLIDSRALYYGILLALGAAGCFYCKTDDYFSGLGIMAGFFAGVLFEERFVNFKNAEGFAEGALRLVLGLGIFLAISNGMKLPFSDEFLRSGSFASNMFRTARYAVASFAVIGPYTCSFVKIKQAIGKLLN